MTEWAARRFWTSARTAPAEPGWQVLLDARPIRTPAGAPLVLPTAALAQAVAAEWDAQADLVDPGTMPMTRTANSAIDKVAPQQGAVTALLAEYAGTDLLCYRAEAPEALVRRQADLWDPLLDWAKAALGARPVVTAGVMPVPQDPGTIARLCAPMHAMSAFRLAAFHDLVALSGSLILAHAAAQGARPADAVWDLSRLDETWQAEHWGCDEEAARAAATKRQAFLDAHRFYALAL